MKIHILTFLALLNSPGVFAHDDGDFEEKIIIPSGITDQQNPSFLRGGGVSATGFEGDHLESLVVSSHGEDRRLVTETTLKMKLKNKTARDVRIKSYCCKLRSSISDTGGTLYDIFDPYDCRLQQTSSSVPGYAERTRTLTWDCNDDESPYVHLWALVVWSWVKGRIYYHDGTNVPDCSDFDSDYEKEQPLNMRYIRERGTSINDDEIDAHYEVREWGDIRMKPHRLYDSGGNPMDCTLF